MKIRPSCIQSCFNKIWKFIGNFGNCEYRTQSRHKRNYNNEIDFLMVFWCFQGVEKACIGKKWLKYSYCWAGISLLIWKFSVSKLIQKHSWEQHCLFVEFQDPLTYFCKNDISRGASSLRLRKLLFPRTHENGLLCKKFNLGQFKKMVHKFSSCFLGIFFRFKYRFIMAINTAVQFIIFAKFPCNIVFP